MLTTVEMNVESLESKNRYETELEKVKKQLNLMEGKKQVLEQELANNTHEKEKVNLKAKQKVLEDVGEMMQSELQCQICSELFVVVSIKLTSVLIVEELPFFFKVSCS